MYHLTCALQSVQVLQLLEDKAMKSRETIFLRGGQIKLSPAPSESSR